MQREDLEKGYAIIDTNDLNKLADVIKDHDINSRYIRKLFEYSLSRGKLEASKFLLTEGFKIDKDRLPYYSTIVASVKQLKLLSQYGLTLSVAAHSILLSSKFNRSVCLYLIKKGINLKTTPENKRTFLFSHDYDVIQLALEKGADPNHKDANGETYYDELIKTGNGDVLMKLIINEVDVGPPLNLIMLDIKFDRHDLTLFFIRNGKVSINAKFEDGRSLLLAALQEAATPESKSQGDTAICLIGLGALIPKKFYNDHSYIYWYLKLWKEKLLNTLLDTRKCSDAALYECISYIIENNDQKYNEVLQKLFDYLRNIDTVDENEETITMKAAKANNDLILRMSLKYYPTLMMRNKDQKTALDLSQEGSECQRQIKFAIEAQKSLNLTLEIIEAKNLPKTDTIGSCDPYLKIYTHEFNGKETFMHRSKTINNSQEPVWNESFIIPNAKQIEKLTVHLFDKDSGKEDDFLFKAIVPLTGLVLDDKHDLWISMDPTNEKYEKAQLRLRFTLKHG